MERAPAPPLHPAWFPPGTVVGPWRVEDWAGRGVHGAVYRAVRVGGEQAGPVALKMALLPGDPRLAREVELLSRTHHPSIPRLVDHGEWRSPSGTLHPYLVMEWVDGVPLYDWARQHPPDSQQVLRWLAQLARALAALHAQGGVHRDVKGGNVLVQRSDGRAFLTDFGSGIYPGAVPLTPPTLYPGTPAYRAPESWLFDLQCLKDPTARFSAGPAVDLYALGAAACYLLTGEYPELAEPSQDEQGTWHLEAVLPPPALLRVELPLRAFVLRMLSVRSEERGTAAQLAEALERAEAYASGEQASIPQETAAPHEAQRPPAERSSLSSASTEPVIFRRTLRLSQAGRALAAAGLALAIWTGWAAFIQRGEHPTVSRTEPTQADPPDAGTAGLGEALAAASAEPSPGLHALEVLAEETPPEPQPGQARPDAKGRCPHKRQVALNGGCWTKLPFNREECEENGGYIFKKACYLPISSPGRPPTSSPTDKP